MPDEEKKPEPPKPEPKPDPLACPAGYPPEDWAKMSVGNKRAYLKAIENTKRIIGGKK